MRLSSLDELMQIATDNPRRIAQGFMDSQEHIHLLLATVERLEQTLHEERFARQS
jgi:hypothetical protein